MQCVIYDFHDSINPADLHLLERFHVSTRSINIHFDTDTRNNPPHPSQRACLTRPRLPRPRISDESPHFPRRKRLELDFLIQPLLTLPLIHPPLHTTVLFVVQRIPSVGITARQNPRCSRRCATRA